MMDMDGPWFSIYEKRILNLTEDSAVPQAVSDGDEEDKQHDLGAVESKPCPRKDEVQGTGNGGMVSSLDESIFFFKANKSL